MNVLFVSGIVMVNIFVSAKYIIDWFRKQMSEIHEFMYNATNIKIMHVYLF